MIIQQDNESSWIAAWCHIPNEWLAAHVLSVK